MISSLVAALRRIQLEPTAEEIADVLWLAIHMGQLRHTQEKGQQSESKLLPKADGTPQTQLDKAEPTERPDLVMKPNTLDEPASGLYTQTYGSSPTRTGSGLPFRTPAAYALPGSLELSRVLRPLMQRIPSRVKTVFDEEGSVHRIAEEHIWMPILKPAPERRFEVTLIVDESASMSAWHQTIIELRTLLERHGAFRDVRTWRLVTDIRNDEVRVRLCSGARTIGEAGRIRNPRELADPTRSRLILVVTDCVSRAWHNGVMAELLKTLGRTNSLSIIQVLPQRLWSQSALRTARIVRIQPSAPGIQNTRLNFKLLRSWTGKQFLSDVPFPITTLEPVPLATWARMVAGEGGISVPGFIFPAAMSGKEENEQKYDTENPEQRVQMFQAAASSTAFELAALLAAAPLSLPVMRLIQQTLLPYARQVHLAEVFLSGLLKQVSSGTIISNPDTIQYDFVEGVRDLLLDSVPISDAVEVLKAVSRDIEARLGQTLDFEAILANPTSTDGIEIDEQNRPFAAIAARVLRRLGGPYLQLAERLDLQGRLNLREHWFESQAELRAALLTRQVWNEEQVGIWLEIRNTGRRPAENVRVTLSDGSDYTIIGRNFFIYKAINPQQGITSEFIIGPHAASSDLRLKFEIVYNDLHDERKFAFEERLNFRTSLQEFHAIPNSYSTGTPTHDSKMFYGREKEVAFLQDNLTRPARSVIVLYGQRRLGKTTLLLQLINSFALGDHIPVFIDLQGISYYMAIDTLLYDVALAIAEAMERRNIIIPSPVLENFAANPFHTFNLFLSEAEKQLAGKKLILLFDEFEVLEEQVVKGRLRSEIFEYLRDVVQHRPSISFLFSGTHKITEQTKWYRAVFFQIALHYRLSHLSPEGAEGLIKKPVEGFLEYDPHAVIKIRQLTADQPYLIHLMCRIIVDYCNKRSKTYVTINDVNTVLQEVMEMSQYHFDWLWDQISPEERVALAVVAEGSGEEGRWLSLTEIEGIYQNYHIPGQFDQIKRSLQRLLDADIITTPSYSEEYFGISPGLLRRWLLKEKPLKLIAQDRDL